jgi:hypothetical protein
VSDGGLERHPIRILEVRQLADHRRSRWHPSPGLHTPDGTTTSTSCRYHSTTTPSHLSNFPPLQVSVSSVAFGHRRAAYGAAVYDYACIASGRRYLHIYFALSFISPGTTYEHRSFQLGGSSRDQLLKPICLEMLSCVANLIC